MDNKKRIDILTGMVTILTALNIISIALSVSSIFTLNSPRLAIQSDYQFCVEQCYKGLSTDQAEFACMENCNNVLPQVCTDKGVCFWEYNTTLMQIRNECS